ncbi:MAG: hypothetical protein IJ805_04410 [Lachnospiraceae bacterium]|nr:hypothetical protein [Lachnospiraceae bacterium]
MESEILALCDRDTDYLEKFNNYISLKYGGIFECHSFTDIKPLMEYGLRNEIAVLMIEDSLFTEDIKRLKAGRTYILDEEGEGFEDNGAVKRINRFRAADEIIREILQETCKSGSDGKKTVISLRSHIVTVFSPVSRCLKTTVAVTLSQLLSDRGRTLYINTESFSGFNQLFMKKYENDLSDALFYLKSSRANFAYRLQGMVTSSQGYDYIPPAMLPADIYPTEGEVWTGLFDEASGCGYEYIVIDMGSSLTGMFEIMKRSEKIFMPVRSDTVSKAKLTQFEALLHISGNEELIASIERLQLPYFEGLPSIAADLRMTGVGIFMAGRI